MKLGIPVDENNVGTKVCVSFGRAPYFMIYDTDIKESAFVTNTAADSAGGAGIKAAQIIVDNKVDVLLTPRSGENAADVLKEANIKIYKTTFSSAKENIDAYNEGKLAILDEVHSGFHGHGGN